MNNIKSIHSAKPPIRLHFIPEWTKKLNLSQADICRMVGADKSLVSRWFDETVPRQEYLEKLADLFGTDVHGLFRHPDDDWISKFFRDKTEEEKHRAIDMLRLMFKEPAKKTRTTG